MTEVFSEPLTFPGQAAVLVAFREGCNTGEEQVLLTLRAEHLSSHGGEVAFPGGMWETDDRDLCFTALREAHEEVGLPPSAVAVESQLPIGQTRAGVQVTPYVGRVVQTVPLTPNPAELDSLFWMPVSLLIEDQRIRTDIFTIRGKQSWAPVYSYAGYTIWGFTAKVLVEFANRRYGLSIRRSHDSAPEVLFDR